VIRTVDRISFAVGDLSKAREFFEGVLGARFEPIEDVEDFQFHYQPFTLGGMKMQLLSPYDPESVISRFLMKRQQGFHHVTCDVENLDDAVRELKKKGVEVTSRHDYEKPFEGYRVREAFIHPRDAFGILFHLVERTPVGTLGP
jgi:methylmalonyl-CoA epimerase